MEEAETTKKSSSARLGLWFVLALVLLLGIVPLVISVAGFVNNQVLERDPPTIIVVEPVSGIGLTPAVLTLELEDQSAGLDQVVIGVEQRNTSQDILKESLGGARKKRVSVTLGGRADEYVSGRLSLVIRVFDRSFWSNKSTLEIPVVVDYSPPGITPITLQHNGRRGGSQLVFYRAKDEHLVESGVTVGERTFKGFPASLLDLGFSDNSVFAALYSLDREAEQGTLRPRLYAVDAGHNRSSTTFVNRILKVTPRKVRNTISSASLKRFLGDDRSLAETPALINERVAKARGEIAARLASYPLRSEFWWDRPLARPDGTIFEAYNELATLLLDKTVIGELERDGFRFGVFPKAAPLSVRAAQDGQVLFVEKFDFFGEVVAIDHGLGLVSLYGSLGDVVVAAGGRVNQGDVIATMGIAGLADTPGVYFELTNQGLPINPIEFWDERWYSDHIKEKIANAKRLLGVPLYRRLK